MSLTEATAQQLAWQRNRDEPNDKDKEEAANLVTKWNGRRASKGMAPLNNDYEPVVVGCIVVEVNSNEEETQ